MIAFTMSFHIDGHTVAARALRADGTETRTWAGDCATIETTLGDSTVLVSITRDALEKLARQATENKSRKARDGGLEAKCLGPPRNVRKESRPLGTVGPRPVIRKA